MLSTVLAALAALAPGFSAWAEEGVRIGERISLKCDRHNPSVPPWTNAVNSSKSVCLANAKDVAAKQKEHAERVKKSGELVSKSSAARVAAGKDAASMIQSMKQIYADGINEYEQLAEQSKKAADDLKKKQKENEKAIKTEQAELQKAYAAGREKLQRLNELKQTFDRENAKTGESRSQAKIDSLRSEVSKAQQEKAPIDKVIDNRLHDAAIQEQGKVVVASRGMESVLRDAERKFLARRDDLVAKKAKLDEIKLGEQGGEKGKLTAEKVAQELDSTERNSPKKYEPGTISKIKDKLVDGWSDPVDPNLSKRQGETESYLKSISDPKEVAAAPAGKESKPEGATKVTSDILGDLDESGDWKGKDMKGGREVAAQTGLEAGKDNPEVADKIASARSELADKSIERLKADTEAAGGPEGVRQKAEEAIRKSNEDKAEIERIAKGMPLERGTVEKLDDSSPKYEQQKALEAKLQERNDNVAKACENVAVCNAITDAGLKREASAQDLSVYGDKSRTAAERMRDGELYRLDDNGRSALQEIKQKDAAETITRNTEERISTELGRVEEAKAQAQRVRDEAPMRAEAEKFWSAQGAYKDEISAVELKHDADAGMVSNNPVATGAVYEKSGEATRDDLNVANRIRQTNESNRELLDYAPGGTAANAVIARNEAEQAKSEQTLLGNNSNGERARVEAEKVAEEKTNSAIANTALTAATGGAITTNMAAKAVSKEGFGIGEAFAKSGMTTGEHSLQYFERSTVPEGASSARAAVSDAPEYRPAPPRVTEEAAPSVAAAEREPAPTRVAEEVPAQPVHASEPVREPASAPVAPETRAAAEEAPAPSPNRQPARVDANAETPAPPPARVEHEAPASRPVAQRSPPEAPYSAPVREGAGATPAAPAPVARSPVFAPPAPASSAPPVAHMVNAPRIPAPAPAPAISRAPETFVSGSNVARSVQAETVITREAPVKAIVPQPVRTVEARQVIARNEPVRNPPNAPTAVNARAEGRAPARAAAVPSESSPFFSRSPAPLPAANAAERSAAEAKELAAMNQAHPASSVEMPPGGVPASRARGYDPSSASLRSRLDDVERGGSSGRSAASGDLPAEKSIVATEEPAALKEDSKLARAGSSTVRDEALAGAEKLDPLTAASRIESGPIAGGARDTGSRTAASSRGAVTEVREPAHASRNVQTMLDKVEANYPVTTGRLPAGAKTWGDWSLEDKELRIREDLLQPANHFDGQRTTLHEATHMTTDLRGKLEQASVFSSDSEKVFGQEKMGGYGALSRSDEAETRIRELAAARREGLILEKKIEALKPGPERTALEQQLARVRHAEDQVLGHTRAMVRREMELNTHALGVLENPRSSVEAGVKETIPGRDRLDFTFTDAAGKKHSFSPTISQHAGLGLDKAIEAQTKDILTVIERKFGRNGDAMRAVDSILAGNPQGAELKIIKDVQPEKEIRPFYTYTGVDDVQMRGFVDAKNLPAFADPSFPQKFRAAAIDSIERRQSQLSDRLRQLEKHYGRDPKHYDFGSEYRQSPPVSAKSRIIDQNGNPIAKYPDRGPESPRIKQSPYAERMERIYGVPESPVRAPAAVPNPERKMRHLAEEHAQFKAIGPGDNKNFIKLAEAANAGEPTALRLAASMQAAIGKFANDVMIRNKDVVNQVFNLQKALIWEKVSRDPLLAKHLIGQYSDFNTVRFAFNSNDKAITKRLTEIYGEYNGRYAEYMDKVARGKGWDQKALGLAEKRANWHHLGIGNTPDEANLAARKSRELFDENGLARPRTYEEVKGAVAGDLDAIEKRRLELENKFGDTEGMFVGEKGGRVLSAEANEAIRKAEQTDAGVKKALENQFGTKLSDSEVTAFRDYVNKADAFSPDLYVAERVEVPLDARRNGIVSADFKGQNARNLEESMRAMVGSRGKPLGEQVRAIRAGEADATRVLEAKKADFRQAVKDQFGKADQDWERHVYFTGDDGIYLPAQKLTAEEKAAFAGRFSGEPDSLRLTFGQSRFADNGAAIPRDTLKGQKALSDFVVDAEKVEKDLRKGLMNKFRRDVTNSTQMVVDLIPRADGTRSVGLYLGGKHTPEQMQEIRAWSQKYLRGRGDDLSFVQELGTPRKTVNDVIADAIWASKLEPRRIGQAEKILGRAVDEPQRRAIMSAHFVGAGKAGADGTAAGIGNYTKNQIAEKARILDEAGFTMAERRKLMEAGIVGDDGKAGIRLEYDTRTGDSKIARAPAGAELVQAEPAPKTVVEARQRWLESGEPSDIEEYGQSVPPEESVAEYKRLTELRSPKNMPASPGEVYYQRQVNYLRAQKELVSNFENEDAFGGLEKALDMQFKLDEELKKNQTALKHAVAQQRP